MKITQLELKKLREKKTSICRHKLWFCQKEKVEEFGLLQGRRPLSGMEDSRDVEAWTGWYETAWIWVGSLHWTGRDSSGVREMIYQMGFSFWLQFWCFFFFWWSRFGVLTFKKLYIEIFNLISDYILNFSTIYLMCKWSVLIANVAIHVAVYVAWK